MTTIEIILAILFVLLGIWVSLWMAKIVKDTISEVYKSEKRLRYSNRGNKIKSEQYDTIRKGR